MSRFRNQNFSFRFFATAHHFGRAERREAIRGFPILALKYSACSVHEYVQAVSRGILHQIVIKQALVPPL